MMKAPRGCTGMNAIKRTVPAVMSLTVLSAMGAGFANFDFIGPLLYLLVFAFSYSRLKRTTEWKWHLAFGVGSLATFLTIVVGTYLMDRVDIRQLFPFPVSLPVAACLALLGCLVNGALLGFAAGVFGSMLDRRFGEKERIVLPVVTRSNSHRSGVNSWPE